MLTAHTSFRAIFTTGEKSNGVKAKNFVFSPKGILHGRDGLERKSFPPVSIPA